MAQDVVAHTIGVILLIWVVGYTLLRAHEALNRNAGSLKGGPAAEGRPPRRWDFAYAAQRRREGRASAPFWAALAGVASLRKIPRLIRRRSRKGQSERSDPRQGREPHPRPGHRDQPRPDQPDPSPRQNRPGPPPKPDDEPDRPRDDRRTGDVPPRRPPWSSEEPPEVVVEVVGTRPTNPPPQSITPPPRALTGPTPAAPGEPEEPPVTGKYVAVPGTTLNRPATLPGGGDNTHDDAKDFAQRIVTAITMTGETVGEAAQMLDASITAAWDAVDRLHDAGVAGPVLHEWGEAVYGFEAARTAMQSLLTQLGDAADAARTALAKQTRVGDELQTAIQAAGRSAATRTDYYT
jgi:hypothetical protein